MALPVNEDYSEVALSRLLTQFQGKSTIEGLLSAYTKVLQDTQDTSFELLNSRGLSVATNSYLDNLGKLLGETRKGRSDEPYRAALYARIRINSSEGTPKEVLDILKEYTGATSVRFFEHFPANLHIMTDGELNLDTVYSVMSKVTPVCVSDVTIIKSSPTDHFINSELLNVGIGLTDLADENGDIIVDQVGNRIQVTAAKGLYSDSAVMSELDGNNSTDSKPFAEIYDKNIGG